MHSLNKIKVTDTKQAKVIYNFKDIKEALCRAKAAICYKAHEVCVGFMILRFY
jgi:hypothetical protein